MGPSFRWTLRRHATNFSSWFATDSQPPPGADEEPHIHCQRRRPPQTSRPRPRAATAIKLSTRSAAPLSKEQLVERTGLSSSQTARALTELKAAGDVMAEKSPQDGRVILYRA
ncbi:hypothetical protein C3E79_00180 [Corynebacterium liangguodongii]|uniref:DprA winged helix domain-containing protein n=1 Tax=Corynebacterium liangguodongii TaxID=2079535 RepID=A0A2S0WBF6_9CORY|nr:hypothetical protein C3E79_00180 [Corynebacterium liangguodongii]PWB99298.1 MarR family transcriptional regulator [Corynebacterium liangguodongii]